MRRFFASFAWMVVAFVSLVAADWIYFDLDGKWISLPFWVIASIGPYVAVILGIEGLVRLFRRGRR